MVVHQFAMMTEQPVDSHRVWPLWGLTRGEGFDTLCRRRMSAGWSIAQGKPGRTEEYTLAEFIPIFTFCGRCTTSGTTSIER